MFKQASQKLPAHNMSIIYASPIGFYFRPTGCCVMSLYYMAIATAKRTAADVNHLPNFQTNIDNFLEIFTLNFFTISPIYILYIFPYNSITYLHIRVYTYNVELLLYTCREVVLIVTTINFQVQQVLFYYVHYTYLHMRRVLYIQVYLEIIRKKRFCIDRYT